MSRKPRFLSVVGTRPEAIKMAPVIEALAGRDDCVHALALTGQHTEMVDQVLRRFGIESDYDLDLMKPGQSLHDIGVACLEGLPSIVEDFEPDVTIVQGDTATVLFSALTVFFEHGKLAHVEAGLRSHRKWSPFPEEMLRRMTDVLSDFCFAPTPAAAANLASEGVRPDRIFVTGNTIVDALHKASEAPLDARDREVSRLLASGRRIVLLTAHRRESFGTPFEEMLRAVAELAESYPDTDFVYPVHPNPRVREPALKILGGGAAPTVHLVDPLSYGDLLAVMNRASLVLTDSGGIQEEAPAFDVHTLVLREVTERPEGVRAGAATLVGTDPERILAEARRRLSSGTTPVSVPNPYGDGRAAERIADILLAELTGRPRTTRDWTPSLP